MRYFIDYDPIQKRLSACAEDDREMTCPVEMAASGDAIAAFLDETEYGPATIWVTDAEQIAHFLPAGATVQDLWAWQKSAGSPTLPEKPASASGRWVYDAWVFLCRYTGESVARETGGKQ